MLHLFYCSLGNHRSLAVAMGHAQLPAAHTTDDAFVHQFLDVSPPVGRDLINSVVGRILCHKAFFQIGNAFACYCVRNLFNVCFISIVVGKKKTSVVAVMLDGFDIFSD